MCTLNLKNVMFPLRIAFSLIPLLVSQVGSSQCVTNLLKISTGFNPNTNNVIGTGADPKWEVVEYSSAYSSYTTPHNAFFIPGVPGDWQAPNSNATWVNFSNGNIQTTGCSNCYWVKYSRKFKLCSSDTVTFTGKAASDNWFTDLKLDGGLTLIADQPSGVNAANYFFPSNVTTVTTYLSAGEHTISIKVWNDGSYTIGSNPTGFILEASLTSSNSSFARETSACSNYYDCCGSNTTTSTNTIINTTSSYTWAISGITYTNCGVYTYSSLNACGNLHIDSLVLTIGNCCDPWIMGGNYLGDCENSMITSNNNILGIKETNTNPLRIYTNNSEKLRINANGNVGINTLSPSHKLHIIGGSPTIDPVRIQDLQTSVDTTIVTTDINGVFHKRNINTLYSGISNSCTTQNFIAKVASNGSGNLSCSQIFDNNDKVGINTSNPTARLHVRTIANVEDGIIIENSGSAGRGGELVLRSIKPDLTNQNWSLRSLGWANPRPRAFGIYDYNSSLYRFLIDSNGNIGIGTNIGIPASKLELNSGTNNLSGLRLTRLTNTSTLSSNPNNVVLSVNASGDVILVPCCGSGSSIWSQSGSVVYTPDTNNRVVIGVPASQLNTKTNSSHKLWVKGYIKTNGLTVMDYSNWPDYVFSENYSLNTLSEVEKYIQSNKHLPGIPSAAKIKEEGIDVANMQAKQLEKIEELTLYLIDMKKDIEKLKEENRELKSSLNK